MNSAIFEVGPPVIGVDEGAVPAHSDRVDGKIAAGERLVVTETRLGVDFEPFMPDSVFRLAARERDVDFETFGPVAAAHLQDAERLPHQADPKVRSENLGDPRVRKPVDFQIDVPVGRVFQKMVAYRSADRQDVARAPLFEKGDDPENGRGKDVGEHTFVLSGADNPPRIRRAADCII